MFGHKECPTEFCWNLAYSLEVHRLDESHKDLVGDYRPPDQSATIAINDLLEKNFWPCDNMKLYAGNENKKFYEIWKNNK